MDKETIRNLSAEQIRKAMACDTPEELMKLAKDEGISLTREEAEAYLSEMADIDLDSAQLKQVAGGGCYMEAQTCSDREPGWDPGSHR